MWCILANVNVFSEVTSQLAVRKYTQRVLKQNLVHNSLTTCSANDRYVAKRGREINQVYSNGAFVSNLAQCNTTQGVSERSGYITTETKSSQAILLKAEQLVWWIT